MTRHSQGKYCSTKCQREANRASWRLYGKRNRARRRAYYRSYYDSNRAAVLKKTKAYAKTAAGRRSQKRTAERAQVVTPEKIFARGVLGVAIRVGYVVPQPCEKCGAKKVDGHHDNYLDPFNVRWFCRKHHMEAHKMLKKKVGIMLEDGMVAREKGEEE
tara:strand:- start:365 stop:841 length:477 start_codon:yes stop_codon:yes gene_type:complete